MALYFYVKLTRMFVINVSIFNLMVVASSCAASTVADFQPDGGCLILCCFDRGSSLYGCHQIQFSAVHHSAYEYFFTVF